LPKVTRKLSRQVGHQWSEQLHPSHSAIPPQLHQGIALERSRVQSSAYSKRNLEEEAALHGSQEKGIYTRVLADDEQCKATLNECCQEFEQSQASLALRLFDREVHRRFPDGPFPQQRGIAPIICTWKRVPSSILVRTPFQVGPSQRESGSIPNSLYLKHS